MSAFSFVIRNSLFHRKASVTASPLRLRSSAKVNLALSVLGRRGDGYHEIRTVFQSIDLCDELEFYPSTELELCCADLPEVPLHQNLVWRAAALLSRAVPGDRGAKITLRKKIPPGSGLGGGSGNAAATLLGLCRFWRLSLPREQLHRIAAELGSDVPFFLYGGTALGMGRGDEIYPLPDLPGTDLLVIIPEVRISTEEAYRSLSLGLTSMAPAHKIQGFCGQLRDGTSCLAGIFNDFENSILPAYPAVRKARNFLTELGATAVLLSGSGSSVFGFFSDEESTLAAAVLARDAGWRVFPAKTLSSAEYRQQLLG